MKWFKRTVVVLVILAVAAGGMLGVGHWMSRRVPKWYRPKMSREQLDAAANKATNKITKAINFANPTIGPLGDHASTGPTSAPQQEASIPFTQDELNAFLLRWSERYQDEYEKFITDPQFTLKDGKIIFSANITQLGKFGSLFLQPTIDDKGDLHLDISSIQIGTLPVPESMVLKHIDKLVEKLEGWLPDWQKSAEIDERGANSEAVKAAMTELFLHTLRHEPSAPMLFIGRLLDPGRAIPVKLTDVTITDGTITLSFKRMDATERAAALERAKKPMAPLQMTEAAKK